MIFQNPSASLNPRRTIRKQLEDALTATAKSSTSVEDLLAQVDLNQEDAEKLPHQFSGGQQQRIAICRAIAVDPSLLIGDEPIASLDASLQTKIALLMKRMALQHKSSMLFISHDLAIVRLIASRILIMNKGRIIESGTTEQIWNHPKEQYTQNLLKSIPMPDGLGHLPEYHPQS